MRDRPDGPQVIAGVAAFLAEKVEVAVADPGLRFRIKIAAHLLGQVARMLPTDAARRDAEQAELAALIDEEGALTDLHGLLDEEQALAGLRGLLVDRIAEASPDRLAVYIRALRGVLKRDLAALDPRFDTEIDP